MYLGKLSLTYLTKKKKMWWASGDFSLKRQFIVPSLMANLDPDGQTLVNCTNDLSARPEEHFGWTVGKKDMF